MHFLFYSLFLVLWLAPVQAAGPVIKICDDAAEWPPYTYYARQGKIKTNKLSGFSIDVIAAVFAKHKINYEIDLLPWKRCLFEVEKGEKYQMILNATKNPEREQLYYFSDSFYQTHYYYFYSKKAYPAGLNIKSPADLNHYKMGGISGYAYSALTSVNKNNISRTVNYLALIKMLYAGRIDVFAEDIEAIVGMGEVGIYDFMGDTQLGMVLLPGVEENKFYMMFTKKSVAGEMLRDLLNKELASMKKSGELRRLLDRYVK
ncbi:substrate-binding periplasmic protein [Janthinobacterium sp. B9-8]|uniref:substrate-binding periplasmic protein n=1 Tax=Janthinobacterium sp. B9-8 TaxID=1236179 RepID=UPI00061D0167|nr:transporter substrate-binding domain-containing protein [Janthinobacterium sp. B9-8]AMC33781.1 hypothetical protein VN23_03775 [Janthinobacterium sp. B9-8]